ncbi:MAG: thioredoxin-disulfide reductase [candidate division NC10 bacterium]|nr:thioredoxin-disulfide reductase [candidate division NC10 bacterium]
MEGLYDLIIIGGGPAGLTAGIYSARSRLNTLLIERMALGGQVITTELVENYPGFPEGIGGYELGERMAKQAERFGLKTAYAEVTGLSVKDRIKEVRTPEGLYQARAVIIATGADPATLGVPGEERLRGRGVSYCATCDGAFFTDLPIAVVGGGDTAVEEGVYLTRYASSVTIIHRRAELRATKVIQERAFANPKVHFIWDTVVTEILGDNQVEGLGLKNVKTAEASELKVAGVFIFTGMKPNTAFLKGTLELDERGFIVTDENLMTSIPGVFAAGDVRKTNLRQVAVSVGEGALAAYLAEKYLERIGQ